MPETDHYRRFEVVSEVRRSTHGLTGRLGTEHLRVEVVRPDVVRISVSRGGVVQERPTHAVAVDPMAEPVPFDVELTTGQATLQTSRVAVRVGLDPFRIDIDRCDGSAVLRTAVDDLGRPWPYATLNDAFVLRRQRRSGDACYGLGEKGGSFDRSGRDFTMWNTDVLSPHASAEFTDARDPADPRADRRSPQFDPFYVGIPLLYHLEATSGAMSASFLDNSYRVHYDLSGPSEYRIQADGGQYQEYVFAGPDMPGILEAYTWLTGRAPLPPLWALGYHQCRWHRYSQDEVLELARRHRELGVPLEALWLDIEYMDGYRVFTWDSSLFPDPPGLLRQLRESGVRVVTIIDPGVKFEPGSPVFDQAVERDVLCRTEGGDWYVGQVWPGDTVFPDFATAAARHWWGELIAAHRATGVAGIWTDMNEPATGRIPPDRMRFDEGRASHERYHNQYALLMTMATAAGLRSSAPQERPFVLSRAGFAGIQRYAATWMGDNLSRWDHLAGSLPMAAGLGVSGQPFVGADVGGFQGDSSPELFLRWVQYAALTPFFRNHNEIGYADQYVWAFGRTVLEAARAAIRRRYRLLPYLYAAFVQAALTGAPVQRPLVFDHQDDPVARRCDDQFLLGPHLLVAPVLQAGAGFRQVYLPEGDWYDWDTGQPLEGGRFHLVETPMQRIPLFARAGAVVPMWPLAPDCTDGYHPGVVQLHLFLPRRDGSWTSLLHEDDGVSTAAEHGAHLRTTIGVTRTGERVSLQATVDGAGFPESARTAFRLVLHGGSVRDLEVNGARRHDVTEQVVSADQANTGEPTGGITVEIPNEGTSFRVDLRV